MRDLSQQRFDAPSAPVGVGEGQRRLTIKRPIGSTEPLSRLLHIAEGFLRGGDKPDQANQPVGLHRIEGLGVGFAALEGSARQDVGFNDRKAELGAAQEAFDGDRGNTPAHEAQDVLLSAKWPRDTLPAQQLLDSRHSGQRSHPTKRRPFSGELNMGRLTLKRNVTLGARD